MFSPDFSQYFSWPLLALVVLTALLFALLLNIMRRRAQRHHNKQAHQPSVIHFTRQAPISFTPSPSSITGTISSLSPREREVAELAALSLTNKEIAQHLGLSVHTVGNYLRRVYEKLDIRSRVELAPHLQHLADEEH